MSVWLADNLILEGTCQHNWDCRWKYYLAGLPDSHPLKTKTVVPVFFQEMVRYNNHMLLNYINKLTTTVGVNEAHFTYIKNVLEEDTGERFFGEGLLCRPEVVERSDNWCHYEHCAGNKNVLPHLVGKELEANAVTPNQQKTAQKWKRKSTNCNTNKKQKGFHCFCCCCVKKPGLQSTTSSHCYPTKLATVNHNGTTLLESPSPIPHHSLDTTTTGLSTCSSSFPPTSITVSSTQKCNANAIWALAVLQMQGLHENERSES